jgi:hypothetical protein
MKGAGAFLVQDEGAEMTNGTFSKADIEKLRDTCHMLISFVEWHDENDSKKERERLGPIKRDCLRIACLLSDLLVHHFKGRW